MRLAVLVSGHGSNLEALLDAERARELGSARIALVLSDRPGARALERARRHGKHTAVLEPGRFTDREQFDAALLHELEQRQVRAVVLAGFMRILGPRVVAAYPGHIINVHPSLLPAFPGLDAPAQAIAHGVKVSGATVHLVDHGPVDTGPIIAQAAVPVLPDDDARSLHQRIKRKERLLLCEAVRLLARGAISCEGRVVRITS